MRVRLFTASLIVFLLGSPAAAQMPKKGQHVVITLPAALMSSEGVLVSGGSILAVQIAPGPSALSIGGREDWQTAGFPLMLPMKFEKMSRKKEFTEYEFRRTQKPDASAVGALKVRVQHGTDIGAALGATFQTGTPDDASAVAFREAALKRIADATFTGELASLTDNQKLLILTFAQMEAGATSVGREEYKGNTYLTIDLGQSSAIYNDLKFSQPSLVAHVMNERLLSLVKAFAKPVQDAPQVFGLRLTYRIAHKNLMQEYAPPDVYNLAMYSPTSAIKQFADADITSQALVDASVVIVNDNRVEVPLSAAAQ